MNPIDEGMLTRFVGGDMSTAEEIEFVARCEIEPDSWRSVALALIEHRQLVAALREFAADGNAGPTEMVSPPTSSAKTRWSMMVVVAASLCAVFLGGLSVAYQAGIQQSRGSQQVHRDSPERTSETADPSVVVCLQPPRPGEDGDSVQAPSPAVANPAATTAKLAAMNAHPVFPAEAHSLLRQVGFEVDEEPLLYVLDGDDGDRWAVPARNFHLRYVNHQQ